MAHYLLRFNDLLSAYFHHFVFHNFVGFGSGFLKPFSFSPPY